MSSRVSEVLKVLQLLSSLRAQRLSVADVRDRRIAATKEVADTLEITHETVRDALTRQMRPHIRGVGHFDALVHEWLTSGSRELETVVRHHAIDRGDAHAIDAFFASHA